VTGDAVRIWSANLDEDTPLPTAWSRPTDLPEAAAMVTPLLAERLKRRRRLTRGLLAPLLGCPPDKVHWTHSLTGQPQMPDSTRAFSTSHCGNAWWMASAAVSALGIDVERVREIPDGEALARRFFHPNEQDSSWADPRTFLALWTAKEAVLKAEGCGIAAELAALDASAVLAGPGPWRLVSPSGRSWDVERVASPEDQVTTLAMPAQETHAGKVVPNVRWVTPTP